MPSATDEFQGLKPSELLSDSQYLRANQSSIVRSIERLSSNKGSPIEPGEKLNANFVWFQSQITVLVSWPLHVSLLHPKNSMITSMQENTPRTFRWKADFLFVLSGEHSFIFEPSSKNPGRTTLINTETFRRANIVLMQLFPPIEAVCSPSIRPLSRPESFTRGSQPIWSSVN